MLQISTSMSCETFSTPSIFYIWFCHSSALCWRCEWTQFWIVLTSGLQSPPNGPTKVLIKINQPKWRQFCSCWRYHWAVDGFINGLDITVLYLIRIRLTFTRCRSEVEATPINCRLHATSQWRHLWRVPKTNTKNTHLICVIEPSRSHNNFKRFFLFDYGGSVNVLMSKGIEILVI